jgi:hypothetical protein
MTFCVARKEDASFKKGGELNNLQRIMTLMW